MTNNIKNKKKPVFLVVQHLRPGGIEVLALNLLEKMQSTQDIHIVALDGQETEALKAWPVLAQYKNRLHFLGKPAGFSLLAVAKLTALLMRHRPVAVHTHHIGPLLYGGLAARACGISNIVHTEHDGWHLTENGALQSKLIALLKPKIIAVANHVGECVQKHCRTPKPQTLYNGIDTGYFSPGHQDMARFCHYIPRNAKLIGTAGRMETVKGHRHLLEALQSLPQDVHLALAGDGSLRNDLENLAKDLGLEQRVHFLGRVDHMASFYRMLDVFCLPSLNEGFPLSPLEAQSCGIPSVLSAVGGCAEALCPKTGLLAEPGNAKDLAQKLEETLTINTSVSPRDFITQNFDLNTVAKGYAALYNRTKKQPKTTLKGEIRHAF